MNMHRILSRRYTRANTRRRRHFPKKTCRREATAFRTSPSPSTPRRINHSRLATGASRAGLCFLSRQERPSLIHARANIYAQTARKLLFPRHDRDFWKMHSHSLLSHEKHRSMVSRLLESSVQSQRLQCLPVSIWGFVSAITQSNTQSPVRPSICAM